MKTLRIRPGYYLINVRSLILIYALLSILAFLLSRPFLQGILREGAPPDVLSLAVFFTIPGVLLVLLVISGLGILRDLLALRPGSRFQARLLVYFSILVLLTAAPMILITGASVNEVARFWRSVRVDEAMDGAQRFATDYYSLSLEKLEEFLRNGDQGGELPEGVLGVQVFVQEPGGPWVEESMAGDGELALKSPPALQRGFAPRELPRDRDLVRYTEPLRREGGTALRVISYSLGAGFDSTLGLIDQEKLRFEIIDSLRFNLRSILIFYYGVFFLPILLMTLIVAVSFTRRVTQPIIELTEATHRVAEGDFSVQILARRGDELGLLIQSFNAMVLELRNSQNALVKAEKISLWQSMAQQLAHEIKNPLTPIRLSAERVLRRWKNEPDRVREILESSMLAIIQEVESLSTLLTEFRTLSRPMEISDASADLRRSVEETIMPYRSSHPGIRFDIDHVEGEINLRIDKHRLGQILTNLVINGIDAMEGKGVMEIRSDLVKKHESRYCRISLKDSGKGIAKEESGRVFTPYFTTKESGTGLGLPIVERIVNDHGGAIWFNSAEGVGTTFYIDMPLYKGNPR
jgi:nitrogen fixation/metabolism regulation signal transduction histidine kinase